MAESSDSQPSRRKISSIPASNNGKSKKQERRSKITASEKPKDQNFDPNVAKNSLRRSFLFTLIIGTVLILTPMQFLPFEGVLKIAASAVLMFFYYLAGIKYVRSSNTRAVFADSLYYLGFLFTFIALVGAMTALNELNIQSIIGQMGPALVTTVIGMAARIYLTQFEPITSEPETEAISAMSNLSAQLITSLKNLEDVQRSSLREIETFSRNLNELDFSKLQTNLMNLSNEIVYLSNSGKDLRDSTDRTKFNIDQMNLNVQKLEPVLSEARTKIDNLDTSIDQIQALDEKVEKASQKFEKVGENLENKISISAGKVVNSITETTLEAGKAKNEAIKLTETLKKTVTEVADFLNRQK